MVGEEEFAGELLGEKGDYGGDRESAAESGEKEHTCYRLVVGNKEFLRLAGR